MVYYVRIVINRLRVKKYGLRILKIQALMIFVLCLKMSFQKSNGMTLNHEN